MNAVTAQTNNVSQDYALVISSGNGDVTNALTIQNPPAPGNVAVSNVTYIANAFAAGQGIGGGGISGAVLSQQRVGANFQLLGTNTIPLGNNTMWGSNGVITIGVTNQWQFYVLTNDQSFTNVVFVTFMPPNLALPRMGVTDTANPGNATRAEADIDLYVSTDPGLLNLDPAALEAADKSLSRGGTEVIAYTNALPNQVYYVGVKSEDQEAAEFGFAGVFSQNPFSENQNGSEILHGFPVNAAIPDGSPANPGAVQVMAIAVQPITVRHAVVTDTITHENFGDLLGNLSHNQQFAVLNNHSFPPVDPTPLFYTYIYDDTGENTAAQRTDGPGSLVNFIGEQGAGLWLLTEVDNALTHTGAVNNLTIQLDPEPPNGLDVILAVQPEAFVFTSVDVPPEATNLTIIVAASSTMQLYVRRGALPSQTIYDYTMPIIPPGGQLSISTTTLPPLQAGRYYIGVYNPNATAQSITVTVTLGLNIAGITPVTFTSVGNEPIFDDAVTYSTITVPQEGIIAQTEVGLEIDHPRVSDLAVTLISPSGTRVLLVENRGGNTDAGFGAALTTTNLFSGVTNSGGYAANTNILSPVPTSGTLLIDYNFFTIPDTLDVFYGGSDIFSSGSVSNAGQFVVNYGPGNSSDALTIVMNQGGNPNLATAWEYTATVVSQGSGYLVFTENTNLTQVPIKFAEPPFVPQPSTNASVSDFETAVAGDYPSGSTVDGWTVQTNQVTVINDPGLANSGNRFLALASGVISNTLPTVPGKQYVLTFACRGPGAVGWWRGEGNADDSIYGNNGTLNDVTFTDGEVGQAFVFDGSTYSQVSVPDQPVFILTNSLSIEGWINPAALQLSIIFFRGDQRPGFDPYILQMNADGTLQFDFDDPTGFQVAVPTPPIAINQWWHVAGTLDGNTGTMSIYTNGVLANQINTSLRPLGPLDPTQDPTIGIGNLGTQDFFLPFDGDIDEISLYSRALSASEIQAIYNLGSAGKFDPGIFTALPAQSLAKAEVDLNGSLSAIVWGNNTNWQTQTITFTATNNQTPLQITGLEPGMLLDSFALAELPDAVY